MIDKFHPPERDRLPHLQTTLQLIAKRPEMYIGRPVTFDRVVTYISGFDHGTGGAILGMGLRFSPWLDARGVGAATARWPERILTIAFPGGVPAAPWSAADEHHAVVTVFRLVLEHVAGRVDVMGGT